MTTKIACFRQMEWPSVGRHTADASSEQRWGEVHNSEYCQLWELISNGRLSCIIARWLNVLSLSFIADVCRETNTVNRLTIARLQPSHLTTSLTTDFSGIVPLLVSQKSRPPRDRLSFGILKHRFPSNHAEWQKMFNKWTDAEKSTFIDHLQKQVSYTTDPGLMFPETSTIRTSSWQYDTMGKLTWKLESERP
jgi:hypothetical protein